MCFCNECERCHVKIWSPPLWVHGKLLSVRIWLEKGKGRSYIEKENLILSYLSWKLYLYFLSFLWVGRLERNRRVEISWACYAKNWTSEKNASRILFWFEVNRSTVCRYAIYWPVKIHANPRWSLFSFERLFSC